MATTTRDATMREPRPRESRRVRVAAVGGAVVSIGLIAAAIIASPELRPEMGAELAVWILATATATFATVSLGKGRPSLSMDLPVLLACAFVLGPIAAAVVAIIAVTTTDEWRGRVALSKTVWNHSQTSTSVLLAGYVFIWCGGDLGTWPASLVAVVPAIATDAAVNYLSVAALTAACEGKQFQAVLRDMCIGSPLVFGFSYAAFAATGLLIAEAYAAVGPVSLVVAVAPVALARQVFVSSDAIERVSRQVRIRAEALMRVDERIADERRDERNRIAEALHDDVLQALYSVSLNAQVLREDYRSGRLLDLEKDIPLVVDAAEKAAMLTRDVVFGLRQSAVGRAGLVDTAGLFVAHVRDETGISIVTDLDPSVRADPAVELLVYQVLREALTNITKHSAAEMAWVTMENEQGRIHLSVLDNGGGFDVGGERDLKHFGLDLMRERAEATGGSLEVRSSEGGGTCVEAWFNPSLG